MAESSEESPRLAEDVVPSGIDPARGDRPRRAVLVAGAAVVLALGAAASFPGLGLRDLTADEIGQFHGLGPLGMESRAVDPERFGAHMPLAFQLRWVALAVLGESSAAAWRIHAALGACLGALATFWIVARRGGIGAAVAAGAVVATSPILSFHAHESSNYALAPLTGALTLAGLAELSGKGRAGPWLLGAGLLLGVRNDMFFAFPGAAAAIATAALVYRSRRRARLARRAAWAWAPALGVFAAQAAVFLVRLARLEGSAFDRVIVPHADAGSPEAAAPLAVVARTVTGFAAAYADGYRDAGSVDPWIVAGPVAVLLACAALALARRRGDPLVRSALLLLLGSLGVFVAARLGFTLASGRAFSGGARVFLALLPALAIVVARGGAAAGPVLGPALVLGWLSVQGLATARQVLAVSDGDHRVAARLAREWREGDVILAPATLRARLPETIAGRAPEPPCLRPGEPLPSRVWHVTQPGSPLISGVNTCDGPPKDLVADHGYVPRLVEPWRAPEYEARSNSYLSGVQLVLLEAGTVPAPAVPARRALRFEPAPLSGAKGGRLHVDWVTDAERRTLVDAPFTPELDLEVPDAPGGRIEVTLFPGPPPAWATKDRTGLSHPLGNSVSGWDPRAILASPIDATMVFPLSPLADARLRVGIRALHGALGLVAAASLATAALAPWVGRLRRRLAARPRGGDGDAGGSEPPRDPAPAEAAPPPSHSAAEEPPPVPDPPAPVAEEEPEPPPSPSGWAGVLPDVAICGVLVALGLALRLPVVPHMELTSDGIDPLKEALLVREGRRFFVEHSFLFGYGRAWSFLPLVAGDPGGLLGMGARRAVAQTLVPPLVYLATRLLMGRSPLHLGRRVGPLIAAAAVLTNHGLFETLVTGHQTYFGVEWGSLYVLGLAALVSGRALVPAALLAGAALPMMAMNHPFAAAGAGALLPVLAGAWGTRRWRGLGAFALLCVVALAVGWPHLRHVLFTPHGGAAGFVQQARDSAGGESLSALQVLDLLLAGRLRKGGGLLVFGPVAALAFGIGGALLAGSRPDSRARAARVALFGGGAMGEGAAPPPDPLDPAGPGGGPPGGRLLVRADPRPGPSRAPVQLPVLRRRRPVPGPVLPPGGPAGACRSRRAVGGGGLRSRRIPHRRGRGGGDRPGAPGDPQGALPGPLGRDGPRRDPARVPLLTRGHRPPAGRPPPGGRAGAGRGTELVRPRRPGRRRGAGLDPGDVRPPAGPRRAARGPVRVPDRHRPQPGQPGPASLRPSLPGGPALVRREPDELPRRSPLAAGWTSTPPQGGPLRRGRPVPTLHPGGFPAGVARLRRRGGVPGGAGGGGSLGAGHRRRRPGGRGVLRLHRGGSPHHLRVGGRGPVVPRGPARAGPLPLGGRVVAGSGQRRRSGGRLRGRGAGGGVPRGTERLRSGRHGGERRGVDPVGDPGPR
ncbi:hypothetical protein L6R50_12295 [Myxococcota bacterium]|nr:hypothetical protein [Myxococcota bacterium]